MRRSFGGGDRLGDLPAAVLQPSGRSYIAPDHLGSPHQITDSSGAVVWLWHPDPFGNGGPVGSFAYDLRFPGQYFDQATRLHYNYFRDYDPRTGRYIESDPIGLAGGINTYAYVRNNPIYWLDSNGLTTPTIGDPWGMIQVGKNRWRFFDGNGLADFDLELPGDHCSGPAWHGWTNGVRGGEVPF